MNVTCGVPQSYILGPLLFILYINDFSNVFDIVFNVLFADDTHVFLHGKDLNKFIDTMQIELSKLNKWLLANKLTLNLSKTHIMVYYRAKHKNDKIKLRLIKCLLNK